jgi:hypothetical protein
LGCSRFIYILVNEYLIYKKEEDFILKFKNKKYSNDHFFLSILDAKMINLSNIFENYLIKLPYLIKGEEFDNSAIISG